MKGNNRKNKTILIIVVLVLCIILSLLSILVVVSNNKNNIEISSSDNNEIKEIDNFKSIKEILEYSGAKYISQENMKKSDYNIKILTEFKYNLYEESFSQERYFLAIINRISYFVRYNQNYILIDESKNIEIKVKCKNNTIDEILINGEEDYYLKHDNKNSLNNRIEDEIIELRAQADELETVIDNNWKYDETIFGSKESEFDNYHIFHDEGITVRVIQNRVYNVVFNSKYQDTIVNGIKIGDSFEEITEKLGEPIYKNYIKTYIGYKTNDFYVFFSKSDLNGDEISIYPNENFEVDEFEKLTNKFIDNEINIKEFMNELTYLWPDYDSYKYSSDYLKITYPNKGVGIEYGNDSENGIILYKNYNLTNESRKWIENAKVFSKLEEDLIVKKEVERLEKHSGLIYMARDMFILSDKSYIESDIYEYTFGRNSEGNINKVFFITKDSENYNKELCENITNGFFISDEFFVYGVANLGIYVFNVVTNEKQLLLEGEESFELIEFKENVLYYDEENIILELE